MPLGSPIKAVEATSPNHWTARVASPGTVNLLKICAFSSIRIKETPHFLNSSLVPLDPTLLFPMLIFFHGEFFGINFYLKKYGVKGFHCHGRGSVPDQRTEIPQAPWNSQGKTKRTKLKKGGDAQGSLACCSPWGRKELDMTE